MQSTPILRRRTVLDAMHEGIVACSPSAGLREVAAAMAEHQIHCVVAIDEGPPGADDDRLWGVVSDVDLMRGLASPLELDAGNLAELVVATATPGDSLERAARTMATRRAAHVVVVDDGRPVGVLSALDVARAIAGADSTSRRVVPPGGGHLRGPSFAHGRDPDPLTGRAGPTPALAARSNP